MEAVEDIMVPDLDIQRKMMELYKVIVERPDDQIQILENHRHFVDKDITIICRWRCSCINLFELHPGHNLAMEGDRSEMVYSWIESGLCRCHSVSSGFQMKPLSKKLIHVACIVGNTEVVEYWVRQGLSLDAETSISCFTPIFFSVLINSSALLKFMIDHGADVNLKSRYERSTPLMEAMLTRKKELVEILLQEEKLNVNALNLRNETILSIAVRVRQRDLIPLLIKKGANPNHIDSTGFTPLIHAVLEEDDKIVRILIENGADVNAPDDRGEVPLFFATHNEVPHLVQILLDEGADPNIAANDSYTPLLIATYSETSAMLQVLKLLLEKGADVHKGNENGYTPIHIAAWNGHLRSVELLLLYGSLPEILTRDKNTPLSLAAHGGYPEVVDHLLQHDCNVDNKDKDLDTPLHYAAYNDDSSSVRRLLRRGADPDIENRVAITPLWNAVYANSLESVKLFLKHNVAMETASAGIDQKAQSDDVVFIYDEPKTPLWVAAEKGHFEIARLLILAGYDITKEGWIQSSQFPSSMDRDEQLKERMIELHRTPFTLLASCRKYFRKLFGKKVLLSAEMLEVPGTVKSYLTLKDLL